MDGATTSIALILYTSGLEYDDRVRKEIMSLTKLDPKIKFEIFALVPENKQEDGITEYGASYHIQNLLTRKRFKSHKFRILKAFEFYCKVKPQIKNFDIVWCADDMVTPFFLLFTRNKPLIWDLHEIPYLFLKNKITKFLFHIIEKRCSHIFHANQERIDYLMRESLILKPEKHVIIRNYPDSNSIDTAIDDKIFNSFVSWLGNSLCVYLQGLWISNRYPFESVSAILHLKDIKVVIVGTFQENIKQKLIEQYGDEFITRVYFTGQINQRLISKYINKCHFGLVFYKTDLPNNRFCEPNRMFQTIIMGKPVIVGCNKPMSDLVNKFNFGIALQSDGHNVEEIIDAIKRLLTNYEYYIVNCERNKDQILWQSQERKLHNTILSVCPNFKYTQV